MIPQMDSHRLHLAGCMPFPNHCLCITLAGISNELRVIIYAQVGRFWIQPEKIFDCVDHVNSQAASSYMNGQTDSAEFVYHVEELERTAIHRLIEPEVACTIKAPSTA